jgi:hypothetical protein
MNAILQLKTGSGLANRQTGLIPNTSIDIVFVTYSAFEPPIKNHMNSIISAQNKPADTPSQLLPRLDATGWPATLKNARFPDLSAFSSLAPPEVFQSALAATQQESALFDASLRALNHRRFTGNSYPDLKLVEFFVELPEAKVVQLAADFTDWEESPLDMIRFDGGIWSTTVPLPVGIYAYRFLVDGEWHDDPRALRRAPGSRGATKAFVQVK